MTSKNRKLIQIGVPILIAILFGWYTFARLPVEQIIPQFKSADFTWIAIGIFLGFLSHLSRAYRWQFLLEPLGYSIKFPNSIMAVFIAYGANYVVPRSGEVLRAVVTKKYEDIPFEKGFGTIVAERMADMLVLLIIIGVTLIIQFEFIWKLLTQNLNPLTLLLSFCLIVFLCLSIYRFLTKSQSNFAKKARKFFVGLLEGVTSIFKMKKVGAFIFHTFFIWGMYLLMFYVTTFALDGLAGITIGAILIAFIASSFSIAATNGGIFVYPLAVLAAFSLFGLAKDVSLAFGWIMWTAQTVMLIVFSLLSVVILPMYNRKGAVG